jgi:hypothetical protein
MKIANLIISLVLVICFTNSVNAQRHCKVLKFKHIKRSSLKQEDFVAIDSTDGKRHYTAFCKCENNSIVLGNFDAEGVPTGDWKFDYFEKGENYFSGTFKDGKMHDTWYYDWDLYVYENGKFIEVIRSKF